MVLQYGTQVQGTRDCAVPQWCVACQLLPHQQGPDKGQLKKECTIGKQTHEETKIVCKACQLLLLPRARSLSAAAAAAACQSLTA